MTAATAQIWIGIVIGILTIVAIVGGPVRALRIQRTLDEERECRSRKLGLFRTLMSHRATRLDPLYVQALNLIDIEFKEQSELSVRNAWKELQDHYTDWGRKLPEQRKVDDKADVEKADDLLADLLVKMGATLNYNFDKVFVKKGVYYPEGLGGIEQEQHLLRKRLLGLLTGTSRLPVAVFEEKFPPMTVLPDDQAPADAGPRIGG